MIPVRTETLSLPPLNRREILRYAGAKAEDAALSALLDECLEDAQAISSGRVCWTDIPIQRCENRLNLEFVQIQSDALRRNLAGCDRAVVFAATIGLGLDRLLVRYSRLSPAKALLFQAIGAERIEALCDVFCEKIAADTGLFTAPRFSPGYGDLPLSVQSDMFRILDCPRNIGLTLNGSLLMTPSKSVTAIVGLRACPGNNSLAGCSHCSKSNCVYRRLP